MAINKSVRDRRRGLKRVLAYRFQDTSAWDLKIGDHKYGEIVHFNKNHEEVIAGNVEIGFHVTMMDYSPEVEAVCLCVSLDTQRTMKDALNAITEWMKSQGYKL